MRILVVDDDAQVIKLFKDIVSRLGECDTADSGQGALTAFEQAWQDWRPFSLIFLDVLMPDLDGIQVLLKIREIEKAKNISEAHKARIMMVTGASEEQTVIDCLKNGCDAFIVKPVSIKLVFEKIKKLGFMTPN